MQNTYYNLAVTTPPQNDEYQILSFGAALRYYRKRAGYTQEQLASILNLSQGVLSKWEGQAEAPRDTFALAQMAEIFGVPIDDLESGRVPKQTAYAVTARPGQETVAEMLRRLAPSPEFAREVERFMRLSLADMRRMNEIVDRIIQLEEGPPDEGESEGSDPEDVRARKAKLNNPKELHGEPQTATG